MLQSWWAAEGDDPEATLRRIAADGFEGVQIEIEKPGDIETWEARLDSHGLCVGIETVATSARDLEPALVGAAKLRAWYVNVQVPDGCSDEDTGMRRLAELLAVAESMECPLLIETHRGCLTQDLLRTKHYVDAFPQLRLTIDFSHYVLAGHIDSDLGPAEALLDQLLTRTSSIHLRVSNGHQIQVAVGSDLDSPMMQHFDRWWQRGMALWLDGATRGDILPVVCELGPPPYAIASPGSSPVVELSDRWAEALCLRDRALADWDVAQATLLDRSRRQ